MLAGRRRRSRVVVEGVARGEVVEIVVANRRIVVANARAVTVVERASSATRASRDAAARPRMRRGAT